MGKEARGLSFRIDVPCAGTRDDDGQRQYGSREAKTAKLAREAKKQEREWGVAYLADYDDGEEDAEESEGEAEEAQEAAASSAAGATKIHLQSNCKEFALSQSLSLPSCAT